MRQFLPVLLLVLLNILNDARIKAVVGPDFLEGCLPLDFREGGPEKRLIARLAPMNQILHQNVHLRELLLVNFSNNLAL